PGRGPDGPMRACGLVAIIEDSRACLRASQRPVHNEKPKPTVGLPTQPMSSLPNRPHPGWRAALEWLPALALLLGVALQLRQYVFNRSLWLDEAYLVGGMAGRDMVQLLTQPLDNNQAAPLGFLVLTRMATMALGGSDWVFRLVPWLAGG